jgi:flagellar hook-length control protein FliK
MIPLLAPQVGPNATPPAGGTPPEVDASAAPEAGVFGALMLALTGMTAVPQESTVPPPGDTPALSTEAAPGKSKQSTAAEPEANLAMLQQLLLTLAPPPVVAPPPDPIRGAESPSRCDTAPAAGLSAAGPAASETSIDDRTAGVSALPVPPGDTPVPEDTGSVETAGVSAVRDGASRGSARAGLSGVLKEQEILPPVKAETGEGQANPTVTGATTKGTAPEPPAAQGSPGVAIGPRTRQEEAGKGIGSSAAAESGATLSARVLPEQSEAATPKTMSEGSGGRPSVPPAETSFGIIGVSGAGSAPQRDPTRGDEDRRRPPERLARESVRGVERADGVPAMWEVGTARVAEAPEATREPLTQTGVDRIVGAVRMSAARGGMEVSLRLHPESLGEVRVQVRWEGGVLSARLEAATPAARDALEGGAHTLRATLQDQGIPVERILVGIQMDLGTPSHQQNLGTESPIQPDRSAEVPSPSRGEPVAEPVAAGRVDIRV